MQPTFINANGLEFGLLSAQPAQPAKAPLVLLLHGFPDSAHSFAPVIEGLATAGFHAVAPFMRGYGPTAYAPDGDYSLLALARDVIALIDHLGAEKAIVVGHDWGAAATYAAAAMRPDRIRGIAVAAIPHLRRFLLRPSFAQLGRSSYMARFQWPGIEKKLTAHGCAELKNIVQSWSPELDLDTALAPVWANFADPARIKAALAYYRALPASLFSAELWQLLLAATPVPALVLHGQQDGCIAAEMFAGQEHLFAAGLTQHRFARAGHFMHLEAPEEFTRVLRDFCHKLA